MGGGTLLLNFHSSALLGFFDNGNHAYTHVIQTSLKSHKSHSDVCCKYKSNKKRKPLRDTNPPFLTTRAIGKREKESNLLQNSTNFDFKDKIDVKGNTSYKVKGDEESLSYDQQRADVMKACITTSGAFTVASLIIRQVSHVVSEEGLPFPDCAQIMPYSIGLPQPEILLALVLMISSSRQLLLLFWSEFSESSQTANQMVLGPLKSIWDYVLVAFLSGTSEELLFRGVLLPLTGLNWMGTLVSGIIFGFLHLGAGRKPAFAIWASFVGIMYGLAAISSSSLLVPMAAHSINNLIGGLSWKYFGTVEGRR